MLSGPIPKSMGNLNFSFLFDVSRNKLEGDASFLFGKSKAVSTMDLSRNQFEFDISRVEFSTNLTTLDLNHNKIYGSLPSSLTKLALQSFNVSYNRLCGAIPQGGRLQEYDMYAYFHNKCLCGAPLPPCKWLSQNKGNADTHWIIPIGVCNLSLFPLILRIKDM